jgi:hypothetical protein
MSPSGRNQSEHSPLGVRLGGEAASVGRRFWNKYWGNLSQYNAFISMALYEIINVGLIAYNRRPTDASA